MPAPVAVLVEVDGEPVFQAYIAYCAICRGPCRGAPPPKVAYARPGKKKTKVAQGGGHPRRRGAREREPGPGSSPARANGAPRVGQGPPDVP